ncbi:hypothetical protein JCM14036_17170 [Desulfotomaculum defluvii]
MGQLYSVIMIAGVYIVITKYKFFKFPETILFEEITNKIMDMVVILNEKGKFVKISKHTLDLLGFKEEALLGKDINYIVDGNSGIEFSETNLEMQTRNLNDVYLIKKNKEKIPVNISYIPVYDVKINDFLGSVIVMQDNSLIHELKSKNDELKQKAIRDSLTNLYNHQYTIELVKEEIEKISIETQNKMELSIIMIDIDYFKNVNDTFGHQFGDYVIKTISEIMNSIIKNNGHVGRFGGEEFIIILPQKGINEAISFGEEIRQGVINYKFSKHLKVTISGGIKQHMGESPEVFIKHCDDLLYKAKRKGRNRIEHAC